MKDIELESIEMYQDLALDITRMWNVNTRVVPHRDWCYWRKVQIDRMVSACESRRK